MKLRNIKADLHAHGWCGQEEGFGQIVLKFLGEKGKRDLQTIAERGFEEKQNTLIGLINFDDTRYQKVVNTSGGLPKDYCLYDDNIKKFVGVYDSKKELWSFILRGQEIPTNQGHILILGNEKEIKRRNIEDVLKEAKDMNSLIVGDHILAEAEILSKLFNKITIQKSQRYSLGEDNVRKYKEGIDLIEYCNSNVPKLTEETKKLGKEIGIQGLYDSDSHTLNQLFSSFMIHPELDFSNWEKLKEGIIKNISNEKTIPYEGKNRKLENIYHALAVIYNICRQKLGIVKNPIIKIA